MKNITGRLYFENTKGWERELAKKKFSDEEPKVTIVDKGIILPVIGFPNSKGVKEGRGGVCDENFNFVVADRDATDKVKSRITSAYTWDRKKFVQLDEDVIYGGLLMPHFGHFLIECLNRLWFVLKGSQNNNGGGGGTK